VLNALKLHRKYLIKSIKSKAVDLQAIHLKLRNFLFMAAWIRFHGSVVTVSELLVITNQLLEFYILSITEG